MEIIKGRKRRKNRGNTGKEGQECCPRVNSDKRELRDSNLDDKLALKRSVRTRDIICARAGESDREREGMAG